MCNYKINNSYTVYVIWENYHQAKKITEKSGKKVKNTAHASSKKADIIIPYSEGACFSSKAYGEGILKSKGYNGIFTVQFRDKAVQFLYPVAFKTGSLVAV